MTDGPDLKVVPIAPDQNKHVLSLHDRLLDVINDQIMNGDQKISMAEIIGTLEYLKMAIMMEDLE